MTISELILSQAKLIVTQPGFHDEPYHQIGRSAYFVASAPKHAEGYQQKGKIVVGSGEYLIIIIPRTI